MHIASYAGTIEPGLEGATRSTWRVMNPLSSVLRKYPEPCLEYMPNEVTLHRQMRRGIARPFFEILLKEF